MQSLYQTVKEILDTGRVGAPVFVRCSAQIASEDEYAEDVLVRILTMTCSWMQAPPLRVYAQVGSSPRQFTVTIQYAGGQTSIVSVSSSPGIANRVDLMLLGNKGALYHDADALPPGFDITAEPLPVPGWLVDAVSRSLRAGKPALIQEVSDFE